MKKEKKMVVYLKIKKKWSELVCRSENAESLGWISEHNRRGISVGRAFSKQAGDRGSISDSDMQTTLLVIDLKTGSDRS